MLYTRKGDDGTTYVYGKGSKSRISKSSKEIEALGAVDESNSLIGLCKVKASDSELASSSGNKLQAILHDAQENLFIVQAEIAGADKTIDLGKVKDIEDIIDGIEKDLPDINSFFISGGSELSALLDLARAVIRRCERRVIDAALSNEIAVSENTKIYLNRLSSLLYALVRFVNFELKISEKSPSYE